MAQTPRWRGVTVCTCMPEALDALAERTASWYRVTPFQGSYSTAEANSANTHAGGGVIDFEAPTTAIGEDIVQAGRRVGFAIWLRKVTWYSKWYRKWIRPGWRQHVHGVLIGCPHLSAEARAQVTEYLAGGDGLAGGDPDTGPRAWASMTWARARQIINANRKRK